MAPNLFLTPFVIELHLASFHLHTSQEKFGPGLVKNCDLLQLISTALNAANLFGKAGCKPKHRVSLLCLLTVQQ